MTTDCKLDSPATKDPSGPSLSGDFFANLLRHSQNPDGGWGYHPESKSSTEPTAWSILALSAHESADSGVLLSGSDWLHRAQRPEGSWPAASGEHPGCWVTSLACLALLELSSPQDTSLAKGLEWLCATWPAEGNTWWRFRQRWQRASEEIVRQDHSLRGWGWTPETASWVEPTAYGLLLLQNVAEEYRPREAGERMQLAERMLYDRVCPGGGWNAGNPIVYGEPGIPRVGPTVWALLALRNNKGRSANVESLEWLERNQQDIPGPGSLALSQLCLKAYGRSAASIEPRLHEYYLNNQFLQNLPVLAWASLAAGSLPAWLRSSADTKGKA